MTSNFRWEVVIVSFTTTVSEFFANLRFLIEVPSCEITRARTYLPRLLARIDIVRRDAKFCTLLPSFKLISITEATAVNKLTALLPLGIVVPLRMISLARTSDFRQEASSFPFRLYANLLALFLRFKSVLITLAASVPESRAATIIRIVEPFNGELPAGTSILLQAA